MGLGKALFGSETVPLDGLVGVIRNTFSENVHVPENGLGLGKSSFGGEAKPPDGLSVVFRDTLSHSVHVPEIVLGLGIVLFGGEAEPPDGFSVVFRDTVSHSVHEPEIVLGLGITLFGGEAGSILCLVIDFRRAIAIAIHAPKSNASLDNVRSDRETDPFLGLGLAPFGGEAVPHDRLFDICRHTFTALMHEPKLVLGMGYTFLGEKTKIAKGGDEVALPVRRHRFVKNLRRALVADQLTRQHYNDERNAESHQRSR